MYSAACAFALKEIRKKHVKPSSRRSIDRAVDVAANSDVPMSGDVRSASRSANVIRLVASTGVQLSSTES